MEYHELGNTGLKVSAISYGSLKFPQISAEQAADCLNRALDLGVNFIDTARNYDDSEAKIGRALGDRRNEFYIASKTATRDYNGAMADLETSLSELQMDYLDLWQLHTISNEQTWQQVMGEDGALQAAQDARDQGLARHIGISIHRSHDNMHRATTCGEFETIMLSYNPVDNEDVAELLALAKQHGLGTIVMKPLLGGTMAYPKDQRKAGLGGPDALVAGALRWVLSDDNVDCVIPGMQAVHEVEENLALADPFVPLSEAERKEMIAALGEFGAEYRYEQRCLRCGYCQPCPQGVNIPAIFQAASIVRNYSDDLKHMGYEMYEQLEVGVEGCVECEECLEKCPVQLPIPDMLKEAGEILRTRQ